MKTLSISKDLQLPLDAVTQTFAILAQRRKGKTYTANVMAEEMVEAGIPWVALDPTGAWWGLRSSADGKKAGLPVYVFGGDHGDLPLERTAGKMIADLVVEHPGWYILDFSHFESKEAERQLATDFAERFYRRKGVNKAPMHLFVDEADMFAPQRTPAGDQRMLGAFESIVRRGGIRGIGTTLITQRAAVLNKNVLEQIDVLIALRTVGPNDRKAIAGYVDAFATSEQQAELMGSIASLELGEAWVWEPGNDLFKRIKIRKRHTFNSSATPKTGDVPQEIITLAKVDLEKIRDQMAATIEQVKSEDPTELKRQVKELTQQLADRKPQVEMHQVEVLPVGFKQKLADIMEQVEDLYAQMSGYSEASDTDSQFNRPAGYESGAQIARRLFSGADTAEPGGDKSVEVISNGTTVQVRPDGTLRQGNMRTTVAQDMAENLHLGQKLSKAAATILNVLAQYPNGRTRIQISILSGYSKKSSSFANALGELRSRGYISPAGSEPITITEDGLVAADKVELLPKGKDLIDYWLSKVNKAEAAMLRALTANYPSALNYDQLQEMTGYSRTSSSFANALGKLRSLELASRSNPVKASDIFFEGEA